MASAIKTLAVLALVSFCSSAAAQQRQQNNSTCVETKKFFDFLKTEYKEVPVMAANYNGKLLSVWINVRTKTATIVLTDPVKGESCLVADLTDANMIDNVPKT